MDNYAKRLAELVSEADAAYARARSAIYDQLPDGTRIDVSVLTVAQAEALDDLVIAEAELAIFRHSRVSQPS